MNTTNLPIKRGTATYFGLDQPFKTDAITVTWFDKTLRPIAPVADLKRTRENLIDLLQYFPARRKHVP